ncbi:hypothetical protein ACLM5J_20085 [Nocardioides sp. Bht2]|uniref:hypothetical protein n=1 Tax=Nocardioides sp. Bht2 TaxID=3392297 RepID=UPI0039B454B5
MKRIATGLLAVAAMSAALLTPTGAANAAISGSDFATKKQAQRGVSTMRAVLRNCRSFTLDGIKVTMTPVSLPKLGADRVAGQKTMTEPGSTRRFAGVVIRKGNKLILAQVSNVPSFSTKKLTRLAKLAYRRAT